ncbi:hypothetical protein ACFUYE_30845, partial [Micromonospora humida]|uniref:hypothetical protein n=1 Tax=Micromonospora humida TaxID=2809018 RepID=UPI00366ABF65
MSDSPQGWRMPVPMRLVDVAREARQRFGAEDAAKFYPDLPEHDYRFEASPRPGVTVTMSRTATAGYVAAYLQREGIDLGSSPVVALPAVEPTDRQLLAATHRWARTNGWTWHDWHGWINRPYITDATTAVDWDAVEIVVRRRVPGGAAWMSSRHEVTSVVQAVDVLVALEVLPAELSGAEVLVTRRLGDDADALREAIET